MLTQRWLQITAVSEVTYLENLPSPMSCHFGLSGVEEVAGLPSHNHMGPALRRFVKGSGNLIDKSPCTDI